MICDGCENIGAVREFIDQMFDTLQIISHGIELQDWTRVRLAKGRILEEVCQLELLVAR